MKKVILGASIAIAITSFTAFKIAVYEAKKNTAEVEQVQGISIFVSSKPVLDFEFLGNIKCGSIVMNKDYEDLMPKMVKKALEKYPNADAVIFKGGSIYECDVIKFK